MFDAYREPTINGLFRFGCALGGGLLALLALMAFIAIVRGVFGW